MTKKKKTPIHSSNKKRQQAKFTEFYYQSINALNEYLYKIFGDNFSIQAFQVCLLIALFYPLTFVMFVYVIQGQQSSKFNGKYLFNEELDGTFERIAMVIIMLSALLSMFFAARFIRTKVKQFIRDQFLSIFRLKSRLATHTLLILIALMYAFLVAYTGSSFAADSGREALIVCTIGVFFVLFFGIYFGGVLDGFGGGALGGIIGCFSIGLFGVILADSKDYPYVVNIMMFAALLPFINTVLDLSSWFFSRWFLNQIERKLSNRDRRFMKITLFILADFLLAVFFFILLAILIVFSIEFFNYFTLLINDKNLTPISWYFLMFFAMKAPFNEGFLVLGMLITTWTPTFIHIVIAINASLVFSLAQLTGDQLIQNYVKITIFFISIVIAFSFFYAFFALISNVFSNDFYTYLNNFYLSFGHDIPSFDECQKWTDRIELCEDYEDIKQQ